jgi:lipopolysaccharide transport system ATP-binding protein
MSKPIIEVQGLRKRYRIGASKERYLSLRDEIVKKLSPAWRRARAGQGEFWALKDVSFAVEPGEALGIIGRNGAGKSTLLKILSKITPPTEGRVVMRGRVASLLEVGTGFHPELTGRENIYLNGAILGMTRREIARKFDEIVAFAEIEEFLDTPVKRYSSGMYVRLAFAVAAHLDPEILLVDEVLAVGDAAFQKKCLGKMGDVAKGGRTVLFVSHNMGAIQHLCANAVILEGGAAVFRGPSAEAVGLYHRRTALQPSVLSPRQPHVLYEAPEAECQSGFQVTKLEVLDEWGAPKATVGTWDTVVFRLHYRCNRSMWCGSAVLEIASPDGARLVLLSTQPDGTLPLSFGVGDGCVECVVESLPLAAGHYVVGAGLAVPNAEWLWRREDVGTLTVVPRDVYGSGLAPAAHRSLIAVRHLWRSTAVNPAHAWAGGPVEVPPGSTVSE